jgi:hypothetical protein
MQCNDTKCAWPLWKQGWEMMLLHVVLQCENFVNWAMKALNSGLKVVEPPTTTKQLMDVIKQLQLGNKKKDGFTCIKEQCRWGSTLQNSCKIGMSTKDNDMFLRRNSLGRSVICPRKTWLFLWKKRFKLFLGVT